MISSRKKIDPNTVASGKGESALHVAARSGQVDCIKFLLEEGADVNKKGENIALSISL